MAHPARDRSRVVAHIGADGHRVGGDGTLRADVEPNTLYYMAISGGPNVNPVKHPLIVARTPEQWFDPEDRGR